MKRLLIVTCLLSLCSANYAQGNWHFNATVTKSGDCGMSLREGYIWASQVESAVAQDNARTFNTERECNECRNELLQLFHNRTRGGCTTRITASPCSGIGGIEPINPTSTGNSKLQGEQGYAFIMGQTLGGSFYSTNPANEIKDWSEEEAIRRMGLDPNFQASNLTIVYTGDRDFDNARNTFISINMRDEQGRLIEPKEYYINEIPWTNDHKKRYFTEKEYLDELQTNYYTLTNVNIKEILFKTQKTDSDIEALKTYQAWIEQLYTEISTFKNMAICSAVVYADADLSLLDYTKYRIITEAPDKEVNRLLKLTELSNNEPLNQGFHADVFYNEETKEYVVAFRGTEFPEQDDFVRMAFDLSYDIIKTYISEKIKKPKDTSFMNTAKASFDNLITDLAEGNTDKLPSAFHDLSTDASQAIGKVLTQYKMAIQIGEAIGSIIEENPNIKINITGHSMGGGEGIIAGLVSGQPSYVFNPAGVSDATYEFANVSNKVAEGDYNIIHKIKTTDDPLTNFQESQSGVWPVLRAMANALAKKKSANPNTNIPKAIGKEYTIITNEGHLIEPIAHLFIKEEEALEVFMKGGVEQSINIYTE